MNGTKAEGIGNSFDYAGFWIRAGASLVDTILILLLTMPLVYAIYGEAYFDSEDMIQGVPDFLITYVLPFVVTILFWVYKSATPGKMAVKLKVVDAKTGNPPTVKQSIIRYVGYYISIIPLFLGFIWIAWDSKKQGWHDKIAGTVVVRPKNKGVEPVSFSGS